MENKRHKQESRPTEQAYVKWLQKIVYEKEKELATLNDSIQIEEMKNRYERTIAELQQKVDAQQKEIRNQAVRRFVEIEIGEEGLSNTQTLQRKLQERNRSFEGKLQPKSLTTESGPRHSDLDLLSELKQNKQQYEATKEALERLARKTEELQQDLLAEQATNEELRREIQMQVESGHSVACERDEAYRQLQLLRQAQAKYLDRIALLKSDKEALYKQLLQESERVRLTERSKAEAVEEMQQEIQRLGENTKHYSGCLDQERELRKQVEQEYSRKVQAYQSELSEQAKQALRRSSELQNKIVTQQCTINQQRFAMESLTMQMQQDKQHLRQELELLSLRYSVLENKYLVLQTDKTLKLMQDMEEVKLSPKLSPKIPTEKSLNESLLLDNTSTFLKHDHDQLALVRGELDKIKSERQLECNRMSSEAAAAKEDYRQLMLQLEQQKRLKAILVDSQEQLQRQLGGLKQLHQSCSQELLKNREQLTVLQELLKKKEAEIDKLRTTVQENRKTTVSIITQKDELMKEHEALKRLLRSCTGDIETMKILYQNTSWCRLLMEMDSSLAARIQRATSQWEVKYLVCQSSCKCLVQTLSDPTYLPKLISELEEGGSSEMPMLGQLVRLATYVMRNQPRPEVALQSQPEVSIGPFNLQLSQILCHGNSTNVQPPVQVPQECLQDQLNNQQLLLDQLQQEIEDHPSAHQQTVVTDTSEIKQNFKMVKAVNEQLFSEIQRKEEQLKSVNDKLKSLQSFSVRQEHLRSTVRTLQREIKPNDRLFSLVSSLGSLLQLR